MFSSLWDGGVLFGRGRISRSGRGEIQSCVAFLGRDAKEMISAIPELRVLSLANRTSLILGDVESSVSDSFPCNDGLEGVDWEFEVSSEAVRFAQGLDSVSGGTMTVGSRHDQLLIESLA
jgi:hypothetical protein